MHAGFMASWRANNLNQRVCDKVDSIVGDRQDFPILLTGACSAGHCDVSLDLAAVAASHTRHLVLCTVWYSRVMRWVP